VKGRDSDILASATHRNLRSPSHERSIRLMEEQFIRLPGPGREPADIGQGLLRVIPSVRSEVSKGLIAAPVPGGLMGRGYDRLNEL
jgi:hypothetical protein